MKKIEIGIVVLLVFIIIAMLGFNLFKNKKTIPNNSSEKKTTLTSDIETDFSRNSTLYFNPSQKEILKGEDFSIDAMINPGKNKINAVTLHLIFDQTKLRLDNIVPSENFSLVLADAKIDNTDGTASIDVAVPTTDPSINEVSTMVTLNFHALDSITNSPVDYTPASQTAAEGEMKDVTKTREKALITVK